MPAVTQQVRERLEKSRWLFLTTCAVLVITLTLFRWSSVSFFVSSSVDASPIDLLQVVNGRADEKTCINCHEQAEQFHATGHANALRRSTSTESLELLADFERCDPAGAEGTFLNAEAALPVAENSLGGHVSLDWCFGSGRHARTWVATLGDSQGATDLLEFRWTWYRDIDGFARTPGQPDKHFSTHLGPFGVLYDHSKARRCFGCHSSYLAIDDGRLRLEDVETGVNCQRCHGLRGEHVASDGEIHDDFWQTASPVEAVNRCAECHRRPEETGADEIRPDLARFQPVGLIQSKCFTVSQKLTCTTCHDPHRPLEAQDSLGDWQCLQCHSGSDTSGTKHTVCGSGESQNCLQCHMPKVRSQDPIRFTDHWIRVR
jgi:hypothetical protein